MIEKIDATSYKHHLSYSGTAFEDVTINDQNINCSAGEEILQIEENTLLFLPNEHHEINYVK